MEKEIIYSIKNITKKFPGVTALDNISIDIEKGEILAVVGEEWCRKIYPHEHTVRCLPANIRGFDFEGQSLLPLIR